MAAAARTAQTRTRAQTVIVGLGRTGLSCARYLARRGEAFAVTDSRREPPELKHLHELAPQAPVHVGGFDTTLLDGAALVIASPGVSLREPFLVEAARRSIPIVGDIELFARNATAPIAAITGTNGKSTVTTLVGAFAEAAGLEVRVGGNLGEPALDLLAGPPAAMYVLELSSYQLETTWSLQPEAAAVLNVSPDHFDRYHDLAEYAAAKARIYERAATAIVNLDDGIVVRMPRPGQRTVGFSLCRSDADFRLLREAGEDWLAEGAEPILPLAALALPGRHNAANALAALAVGSVCGFPRAAMAGVLQEFRGLAHRTERVRDRRGVSWIDDSKGTNVGAAVAAIEGMDGPLVLIAGGEGKGQDFTPLGPACQGKVRQAILIGRDARLLAAALEGRCAVRFAASMEEAVGAADSVAQAGDTVLLSPACASFDMFRDYAQRGEAFAAAVRELAP